MAEGGDAGTSGAGAVPLRSAQMMGQQQKKSLPVCLHASLLSNHKDLPVTTTTCVPTYGCTVHDPTCSFSYLQSH